MSGCCRMVRTGLLALMPGILELYASRAKISPGSPWRWKFRGLQPNKREELHVSRQSAEQQLDACPASGPVEGSPRRRYLEPPHLRADALLDGRRLVVGIAAQRTGASAKGTLSVRRTISLYARLGVGIGVGPGASPKLLEPGRLKTVWSQRNASAERNSLAALAHRSRSWSDHPKTRRSPPGTRGVPTRARSCGSQIPQRVATAVPGLQLHDGSGRIGVRIRDAQRDAGRRILHHTPTGRIRLGWRVAGDGALRDDGRHARQPLRRWAGWSYAAGRHGDEQRQKQQGTRAARL